MSLSHNNECCARCGFNQEKDLDNRQRRMLGSLISIAGVGVMAMCFLPNPAWGRMVFILCGLIVLAVGLLLVKAADERLEEGIDNAATA